MTGKPIKQAMILAAGFGKRMGALSETIPKPLIEIVGRSMLDRAIDNLEFVGIEKIVVNTHYKAEMIEEHLRKRKSSQIIISHEVDILETGGGVAKALHHFNGNAFFAVNSDVIWFEEEAPALRLLSSRWREHLDGMLLLHCCETVIGYEGPGDFSMEGDGNLVRRTQDGTAPYIYTGMQILHPRLFEGCPQGAFSLNLLYNKAINAFPPRLKSAVHEGTLLNAGDLKSKKLTEDYILAMDRLASSS